MSFAILPDCDTESINTIVIEIARMQIPSALYSEATASLLRAIIKDTNLSESAVVNLS